MENRERDMPIRSLLKFANWSIEQLGLLALDDQGACMFCHAVGQPHTDSCPLARGIRVCERAATRRRYTREFVCVGCGTVFTARSANRKLCDACLRDRVRTQRTQQKRRYRTRKRAQRLTNASR